MKRLSVFILIIPLAVNAQLSDFKNVNFKKADSIANIYFDHDLYHLHELTTNLTYGLHTDVEKFRSIYTWVCKNIKYDFGTSQQVKRKRAYLKNDSLKWEKWNAALTKEVFKKLREQRKTVCTGYAYLLAELATNAGINCIIVDGYARSSQSNTEAFEVANHSWNAVSLNGKWYLCDPTWSSGNLYVYNGVPFYEFNYNDGYFLPEPEFFFKSHFPLDTSWILAGKGVSPDNFLHNPLVYDGAFKFGLDPQEPIERYQKVFKHDSLFFSFKTLDSLEYNNISIEIDNGGDRYIVTPDNVSWNNQNLTIKYIFNSTGYFDFHIKLKDELIVSYVISVKRKRNRRI